MFCVIFPATAPEPDPSPPPPYQHSPASGISVADSRMRASTMRWGGRSPARWEVAGRPPTEDSSRPLAPGIGWTVGGGRRWCELGAAAVRAGGARRRKLQFTPGLPEANGGGGGGGAPAVRMEERRRGTPPMAARVGKKAERLREGMNTRWRRRSERFKR
jgi:hypothetical protein